MKNYGEYLQNILKLEPNQQIAKLIELVMEVLEENKALRIENQQLKNEVQLLKTEVRQLKDEIAVLKNQPPRPKIEPSNLEKPRKFGNRKANWGKGSKNQKLSVDEEVKIEMVPEDIPQGAVFKGYKKFIVQDLIIKKNVIRYLMAEWRKSDGGYIFAKLPENISASHFGPGIQRYIVHQHNANRVPQNRILADLRDKGIEISAGQIDDILKKVAELLHAEKEQLLEAGQKSKCLQTDDTGARHKGANGITTFIGNDFFAYFKSTKSKSRINFLEIHCANKIEYTITNESLDYIKCYNLPHFTMSKLDSLLNKVPLNMEQWNAFLKEHLFGQTACRILTEGALLGALLTRENITLETILMSDGAKQFDICKHVLCWIHIERSIKRLVPINENDRQERDAVLDEFWKFYRALKDYKKAPSTEAKQSLEKEFDEIFSFKATEIPLAQALKKIRDCKQQLLLVLDHPNIPIHNNTSESDIREYVTKRKVSGGTRSDAGRDARDTFISLYKTCKKLSISFWKYLGDRINKTNQIPMLAILVGQKVQFSGSGP